MFKTANVGNTDRIVRIVTGLVLLALPFALDTAIWSAPLVKWGAIVVGLVLIATALVRFCPLYRLVGASTAAAPRH